VVDATAGEVGSAEVALGVTIRLLAFIGLVYLAVQPRKGRNWARIALAVLYGGLETVSLVIGPITGSPRADRWPTPYQPRFLGSVLFAASRLVHLGGSSRR
jgi:hypothetical protein